MLKGRAQFVNLQIFNHPQTAVHPQSKMKTKIPIINKKGTFV